MVKTALSRSTTLLAALLLGACDEPPPPSSARPEPPAAPSAAPSAAPPVEAPTASPTPPSPPGVAFRIERAAALAVTKVFAVSGERLWRTAGDHWSELQVAGASVRDVTSANGALWVLARGTGANAGHVTILRSSGGDDLGIAWDFITPAEHEPRALAVVTEREFYVGGSSPTLLRGRSMGSLQTSVTSLPSPVESLLYMPDAMMAVRYVGGATAMFRWGEINAVERPEYLFSFTGARESLMARRDGAVWRGRVWDQPVETDRLSPSPGIVPVAATTLRDERVVEIDASHRSRILRDGRWSDVEVPVAPGEIVGLYGARSLTEGLCVMVDREGAVFELVGARWERRVAPPTGIIR